MDKELLGRIQKSLRASSIDAWVVYSSQECKDRHSSWLTENDSDFPHILVVPAKTSPYTIVSSLDASLVRGKKRVFSSFAQMKKILSSLGYGTVALDYSRKGIGGLSHNAYLFLRRSLGAKTVPADFLADIRAIKTKKQIRSHKKAVKLTLSALASLPSLVSRNTSESALRDRLDELLGEPAFPTIVASGRNSANPHHRPTSSRLRKGILLVDIGARVNSACADITRTYYLGKPPKKAVLDYKKVRQALEDVTNSIGPGVLVSSVLSKVPFKMVHALGHPLGLDVHDVGFSFSKKSRDRFFKGNLVALEPAIYGSYGIRIEDDVLVSRRNSTPLSLAPENLVRLRL